ncbi:MAG TPA: Rnase Y domain-containing protein, partial [Vicinamibacterales bacterium]|nr:Rnase Y domain-containing protein [Vicinamibacterales bacterium]
MSPIAVYLVLVISAVADIASIAAIVWWWTSRKRIAADTIGRADEHVRQMREQAQRDAESLKKEAQLEAREKAHTLLADADRQARDRQQQIVGLEQGLADRTRALADRIANTEKLERELRARDAALSDLRLRAETAAARAEQMLADRHRELQRIASLTAEEARDLLLKQIETDARRDAANLVKRLETEARETAAQRARHIITDAIQRSAAEHAIETTVSVVDLPSDDMKGRIIGREGRNIRALEQATGVELIVDDTPGAIILSSFDPFRREVARQAIARLIADGRIHPARIEEVVEK